MQQHRLVWLIIGILLMFGIGCRGAASDAGDLRMELALDPSPPVVGDAKIALQLTDLGGTVLQGAKVRVEGNMNHAGMKPSFADLEETEPGHYTGTLHFTMGGDWFLLVHATTREGKAVEQKIDVRGVRSP